MHKKHELYLAEIQTTFGTPSTTLAAADFAEVLESSSFETIDENEDNPTVKGGFLQNPVIVGPSRSEVNLDFNMRSFGVSTPADWVLLAQAAGFSYAASVLTNGSKYTLTSADTTSDATVWKYGGSKVASSSLLQKAGNVVFDWKITAETNKKAIFSLIGKGTSVATPALATTVDISTVINDEFTPALTGLTCTINGITTLSPIKIEIIGSCVVEQKINGTNGYGQTRITDKNIVINAQVYAENVAVPLIANMKAQTSGAFSLVWGPATKKIALAAASTTVKTPKISYVGNLTVFDVEMIVIDNSFTIVQNNDMT